MNADYLVDDAMTLRDSRPPPDLLGHDDGAIMAASRGAKLINADAGGRDDFISRSSTSLPGDQSSSTRLGSVVLPIEMNLPSGDSEAPTFSFRRGRTAVFTSFPPPFMQSGSHDVPAVRAKLQQYSGFYPSIGMVSVSNRGLGYADAIVSANYRLPSLISKSRANERADAVEMYIGETHWTAVLGSTVKPSIGCSIKSIDGKAEMRLDCGNPLSSDTLARPGKVQPSNQSDYTLSASRCTSFINIPCRSQFIMKMTAPWHLQLVLLSLSTNSGVEAQLDKPVVSLSCGHGMVGDDAMLAQSLSSSGQVDFDEKHAFRLPGANVRLTVEQHHPNRHSWRSSLTLGTSKSSSIEHMVTRSLSGSPFSRLGVGVRLAFDGISPPYDFAWVLRLVRGDVRMTVPVSIFPLAANPQEIMERLLYASFVSFAIDVIVSELLCRTMSMFRYFLGGDDNSDHLDEIEAIKSTASRDKRTRDREDALRQSQLMRQQARSIRKMEDKVDGLIILSAFYGVIDRKTRQWIDTEFCKLDVTSQLSFWIRGSSLRLPATSKRHMLGFYDVLAFATQADWDGARSSDPQEGNGGHMTALTKRFATVREDRRQTGLVAVIFVRYKMNGKTYEALFEDDESVALPALPP